MQRDAGGGGQGQGYRAAGFAGGLNDDPGLAEADYAPGQMAVAGFGRHQMDLAGGCAVGLQGYRHLVAGVKAVEAGAGVVGDAYFGGRGDFDVHRAAGGVDQQAAAAGDAGAGFQHGSEKVQLRRGDGGMGGFVAAAVDGGDRVGEIALGGQAEVHIAGSDNRRGGDQRPGAVAVLPV